VAKTLASRLLLALLPVGVCALVAGCLSGNPSYFPYLLPSGPAIPTHAKPPGPGYFADFDPNACRIELRPDACSAPVRGTQVFVATVYDGAGIPRRHRRVEWMVEGPGSIIEVDESGILHDRGMKVDNKYAFSFTDYLEHCITRGVDEFTIGPGQTWCVVTSAVEGETTVVAYAPAVADWDKARAYARVNWVDGHLRFPAPVTARAGGEYTLGTSVKSGSESDYRIRYRIIDGPPAALASARGAPVDSVTEAVAPVGSDGMARVQISQPAPAAGTNHIAIEVIKPNRDSPDHFSVVSKGETKVTWQAPDLGVTITAPKTASRGQDVPVTYRVAGPDNASTDPVTLTAAIPPGLELVRTEPRALVDGDELIWTLSAGKPGSAQAVYRPLKVGEARLAADARTHDGLSSRGSASVVVTEGKLQVKLDGPKTAAVGDTLPFQATVTNAGDGPAERIVVRARLEEGLEATNKAGSLDQTIASLAPGQSRTISLPVSARKAGKFTVQAGAAAEGDLVAAPQSATVQVQDAQLSLSVHGPARGYVGQEVTWQLLVRNTGEIPLENIVVRATLPPEVRFVKTTEGGKLTDRPIVWNIRRLRGGEEQSITVTGICDQLSGRALLSATATARPAVEGAAAGRSSLAKSVGPPRPVEAAFEIIGIPALQLSLKDSTDPIVVGQRTTYTIRVKNAGTLAAKKVTVSATAPESMKLLRATGPGPQGKIDGQQVVFPALESLAPNAEATFMVEVAGVNAGDARFRAEVRSVLLAQPLRAEEPTRILGRESRPTE
jgi:uncharacterized repeat protein (TIGR01451 family)